MKITTVTTNLFYTNSYILTDTETGCSALVDPGQWTEELENACNEVGMENIKYILLTHGHFDHIFGLDEAKAKTGAQIAVSEIDAPMLKDTMQNASRLIGANIVCQSDADILLNDGDEIELGNLKIQVISTPGHTKGSVCFLCGNTLISGDTMFCGGNGRTDLYGGDDFELRMSFRRLAALPDECEVYPGHDIPTTIGNERMNNSLMRMR